MSAKIFVGRLSYDTVEDTLKELFSQYGEVTSVAVIMDRETNRSKGFGFIEMSDAQAAQTAIKELDGKEVDGRTIAVSAAKEREDRPRRDSGSFRKSW